MIQFNLLPDVKINFIKAQRAKRLAMSVSIIVVVVSFGLLALLFAAAKYQDRNISNLDADIKKYSTKIKDTKDITKILTIQNQLNSLPNLYAKRPVTSRIFSFIQSTTPTEISIDQLGIDFNTSTITMQGKSTSLENVNKYVDTLKFTNFTTDVDTDKTEAFSDVVLSAFSRDATSASFTVKFSFSTELFNSAKTISLDVPKTVTTRSETQLPGSDVFNTEGTN